jgi:hypothetical protein
MMDMPAYLTTVRGRGGLGATNQKLCDVFWSMTSNVASTMSIQALMHFYVIVTSGNAKADSAMNVSYGFPLNTYSGTAGTALYSRNDGALALSTGMKLYIAADAVPVAEYYGFYSLRMIPFFKATGGNEIDVMVSTARAVQCWSWGSYNGAGFAEVHTYVPFVAYFGTSDKYQPLMQYRGINLVVCKLGTAAGTATTGDVVIIPATQLAPDNPATVNNPLPLATCTDPLSSSRESMDTSANSQNPAIIAGSDAYLGTMTFISNADTDLTTIIPSADYAGTSSAVALPAAISTLNDNAGGAANVLYDITAKTTPATNWIVGAAALDALL